LDLSDNKKYAREGWERASGRARFAKILTLVVRSGSLGALSYYDYYLNVINIQSNVVLSDAKSYTKSS